MIELTYQEPVRGFYENQYPKWNRENFIRLCSNLNETTSMIDEGIYSCLQKLDIAKYVQIHLRIKQSMIDAGANEISMNNYSTSTRSMYPPRFFLSANGYDTESGQNDTYGSVALTSIFNIPAEFFYRSTQCLLKPHKKRQMKITYQDNHLLPKHVYGKIFALLLFMSKGVLKVPIDFQEDVSLGLDILTSGIDVEFEFWHQYQYIHQFYTAEVVSEEVIFSKYVERALLTQQQATAIEML